MAMKSGIRNKSSFRTSFRSASGSISGVMSLGDARDGDWLPSLLVMTPSSTFSSMLLVMISGNWRSYRFCVPRKEKRGERDQSIR